VKIWRLLTPGGKAGAIIICVLALISVLGPSLVPYDPVSHNMTKRLSAPSLNHFFGTDSFGRDLFSRIIVGTRLSLTIAVGASIVAVLLGTGIGITSALAGGWVSLLPGDFARPDSNGFIGTWQSECDGGHGHCFYPQVCPPGQEFGTNRHRCGLRHSGKGHGGFTGSDRNPAYPSECFGVDLGDVHLYGGPWNYS
jgi:hypothetical protein